MFYGSGGTRVGRTYETETKDREGDDVWPGAAAEVVERLLIGAVHENRLTQLFRLWTRVACEERIARLSEDTHTHVRTH